MPGVHGLDRREDRHARLHHADRVRKIDRIAHDVGLVFERGRDVDGRVGHDEGARVGGRLHQVAVADAALGAQARVVRHDCAHELVGVQAALHERLYLVLRHELHGARGGGVAVRHVFDGQVRNVQPCGVRHGLQARARCHEHGLDQPRRVRIAVRPAWR